MIILYLPNIGETYADFAGSRLLQPVRDSAAVLPLATGR
jgi:hypothetical protein